MLRTNNEYQGQTQELDADAVAHLSKELSEDYFASKTLMDCIKAGKVDRQLAHSILYVRESRNAELCKALGVELDSAQERAERYAEIRQANEKIRFLEAQLGMKVTALHVKEALKVLRGKLEGWWRREGFGYCKEISFHGSGVVFADFSCNLSGDLIGLGDKPLLKKSTYEGWIESLQEQGFELVHVPGDREPALVDCDVNRRLVEQLLYDAFPSAQVWKTENRYDRRRGAPLLNGVEVYFHQLEEIEALPLYADA